MEEPSSGIPLGALVMQGLTLALGFSLRPGPGNLAVQSLKRQPSKGLSQAERKERRELRGEQDLGASLARREPKG